MLSVTKVRVRGQTEAIITRIRRLLCPPSPLVPFSSKEGLSIAGIPISMTNHGRLYRWTENSFPFFLFLKPVEISKKCFNTI